MVLTLLAGWNGIRLALIYDVYGFDGPSLGDEPVRLAELFDVSWEQRDSDYRGGYFAATGGSVGGGRLLLQANDLRDDAGDYLQLPQFPEARFLLFVDEAMDPDDVQARLSARPQWRLLQRRELD